jgi:hypothetical protein
MIQPTLTDIAYAAGLFDGEGCIQICRRRGTRKGTFTHWLEISIGNTCLAVLTWMKEKFGGRVTHNGERYTERNHRTWRWRASTSEAAAVLQLLLPFLQIKQGQAHLVIAFQQRVCSYKAHNGNPLSEEEMSWRQEQKQSLSRMNLRYKPRE